MFIKFCLSIEFIDSYTGLRYIERCFWCVSDPIIYLNREDNKLETTLNIMLIQYNATFTWPQYYTCNWIYTCYRKHKPHLGRIDGRAVVLTDNCKASNQTLHTTAGCLFFHLTPLLHIFLSPPVFPSIFSSTHFISTSSSSLFLIPHYLLCCGHSGVNDV